MGIHTYSMCIYMCGCEYVCVCILIQRPNSSHNGNTSPPSKGTQSKMATGWQLQGRERERAMAWQIGSRGCRAAARQHRTMCKMFLILNSYANLFYRQCCCCCCLPATTMKDCGCLPDWLAGQSIHISTYMYTRTHSPCHGAWLLWLDLAGRAMELRLPAEGRSALPTRYCL